MSTAQHTPGPWKTQRLSPAAKTWRLLDSQGQIALFSFENLPKVKDESNTRLIAAAPDMLAALYASEIALRSVLRQNVQVDAAFEQVGKAIARATGAEGEGAK